jgi:hypothetical protein
MRLLERIGARAATDLPDAPQIVINSGLASWRRDVVVVMYGPSGGDESLAAALPTGWTLTRADVASHPTSEVLVVAVATNGAGVAEVRRRHPSDPLLAIVPLMADSSVVVDALDAGAEACIRTSAGSVVASYLVAMERRRELERVRDFTRA